MFWISFANNFCCLRDEVDSDVFSQVATSERRKQKSSKKDIARTPRPPAVDSALLRFLSKQKSLREQQNESVGNPSVVPPKSLDKTATKGQTSRTTFSLMDAIRRKGSELLETQQQISQMFSLTEPADTVDTTDATTSSPLATPQTESELPPRTEDAVDPWMGQFNRNNVAKVLMAAGGVDEILANQAGESVQRAVQARTARRKVREFLKERDSMWVEGTDEANGKEITSNKNRRGQPKYGFGDVVGCLVEKGLTAKDIATILTHTPSVALMMPKRSNTSESEVLGGETLEETLERAFLGLLCSTLNLRRYDARKVLRNCPGLLTKRGSKSAQQVVAAMAKLGVSTSSIARDKVGLPTLLSRPPAALFRLIAFLGSDAIRMPINKIGPLLRGADSWVLLDAVAPVARFQPGEAIAKDPISDDSGGGMPGSTVLPAFVGRTMEQRKKLIDGTYEQMSVTAWTLRNEIGTSDLGKVIAAYPSVLLLDASQQVLPVAEYLMNELGIWEDDLARVLQLYPSLLGMSVSDMKGVADFFVAQGVEEENLASIFRSFPALLTRDIEEDMIPVIQFLKSIGIKNIGRFISRLPPILGYSVEKELTPKWEVVRDIYTYPSFELSKFPAFFSYPLDRIKARFEYLREVKRLPISLIAPDLVLRYGDRDFSIKVAGDEGGAAFANFLKDRQSKLPGNKRRGNTRRKHVPEKRAQ